MKIHSRLAKVIKNVWAELRRPPDRLEAFVHRPMPPVARVPPRKLRLKIVLRTGVRSNGRDSRQQDLH